MYKVKKRINTVCLILPPGRVSLFIFCSGHVQCSSLRVSQRDSFGAELAGESPTEGSSGLLYMSGGRPGASVEL